jgi:hypothetical protein
LKGKEIIEMIQEYKVEDFDIVFRYSTTDENGINLHDFILDRVPLDIGYSDKVCIITGSED